MNYERLGHGLLTELTPIRVNLGGEVGVALVVRNLTRLYPNFINGVTIYYLPHDLFPYLIYHFRKLRKVE